MHRSTTPPRRSRLRTTGALLLLAALAMVGACGHESAAPAPTTATPPNETVPAGEVPTDLAMRTGDGWTSPQPLADGQLLRFDALDCGGDCRRSLVVDNDGSYTWTVGSNPPGHGEFSVAMLEPVRTALLRTDFASLRAAAADACTDDPAIVPLHFQVRNGDRVEAIRACGLGAASNDLLASVLVLATSVTTT